MIKYAIALCFIVALIIFHDTVNGQQVVNVKISFKEECHASSQQYYFVYFEINDSIIFEKFTDTNYVVFNVPKFLIKDTLCKAWVKPISRQQYSGSICGEGLGCGQYYWEEFVKSEELKNAREINVNVGSGSFIGCGSLPTIYFKYNTFDLNNATFGDDTISITSLYNSLELYCFTNLFFHPDIDIILRGESGFYEERKDSIGLKRAMAIKQLLVDFGIDKEKIILENVGNKFAKEFINVYYKRGKNKKQYDKEYSRVAIQLRKSQK